MKQIKVDLAMIMPEVDLKSKEYLEYREKYNPFLGFEIHDDWMKCSFDDYDKYFLMHTNFYGKIGIGARMLIFAASLKCKNVTFVGLDGAAYVYEGNHGFQKNKRTLPACYNSAPKEQVIDSLTDQYCTLWNYVGQNYPETSFKNIGYGDNHHKFIKNNA